MTAHVLVQVSGNGSVTSVAAPRLASGDPIPQSIRCGLSGTACYSEASPDSSMEMRAKPGPGSRFTGWTGGCAGANALCTVKASAAGTVGATFRPKRAARASARLARVRIQARFVQSVGKGTLIARGSLSAPARLRLRLSRPGGGPLLTRSLRIPGGPFAVRARLAKGTLKRGASLFPGGFVLAVTGTAASANLPLQMRTVYVASPREGVVRATHESASAGGAALKTLPAGTKQAWAVFTFASQPTVGPVTVSWYQPSGALIGTAQKNNRPTIETGLGAAAGLGAGNYRVVLAAGGRVVKRFNLRIR